jgi:hypothetical protein
MLNDTISRYDHATKQQYSHSEDQTPFDMYAC